MPAPTLEQVFDANELFRRTVPPGSSGWITEKQLTGSVFNYGVMSTGKIDGHEKVQTKQTGSTVQARHKITQPVGPLPTEHDLISWLAEQLRPSGDATELQYLEIGVSVLKAFDTQAAYLRHASLTAFDVEDPNWHRAGLWGTPEVVSERPSLGFRQRAGRATDKIYRWPRARVGQDDPKVMAQRSTRGADDGNDLFYVESDVLIDDGWAELARVRARLGKGPFHLVLSDGLHRPFAVRHELGALLNNSLLPVAAAGAAAASPHWAIVWDDCVRTGGLQPTVLHELVPQLRAAAGRRLCYAQVWIGGWAGVHENPHGCCVLTTLDLPSVMTVDAAAATTSQGKGATFARQLFQTVRSKAQCS